MVYYVVATLTSSLLATGYQECIDMVISEIDQQQQFEYLVAVINFKLPLDDLEKTITYDPQNGTWKAI